ncbi:MAG: hypothetical protein ACOX5T_08040 [Candidatus Cryptobacteroides sp.]
MASLFPYQNSSLERLDGGEVVHVFDQPSVNGNDPEQMVPPISRPRA